MLTINVPVNIQTNVAVLPQITTQTGINVSALSPGSTQSIGQLSNTLGRIGQRNRN